jgi:hypothetical protein
MQMLTGCYIDRDVLHLRRLSEECGMLQKKHSAGFSADT